MAKKNQQKNKTCHRTDFEADQWQETRDFVWGQKPFYLEFNSLYIPTIFDVRCQGTKYKHAYVPATNRGCQ